MDCLCGNVDCLSRYYLIYTALILVIKVIQLVKFDIIKTLYNMSNLKANFNLTNYITFHLIFAGLVNNHFIFFNQIYYTDLPVCLGVQSNYQYGSTNQFYTNPNQVIII